MNKLNKVVLAITMATGIFGCNQSQNAHESTIKQSTVQVIQLADNRAATIKHFSGVVRSQQQTSLAFRVSGTIDEIMVTEGDVVKKGQVIARLDKHDYLVVLAELEAKMQEAQSVHKLAQAELKRVKQASQDNAIAQVNLDRAISGYERSRATVDVVEQNIRRANDMLSYTELKAPFNGVIARVDFEKHEQILSGISLAMLQDHSALEVEVDVPETMIEAFTIGQIGTVSWYHSEKSLNAYVTEIGPLPHIIKQTYTVTYRIAQDSQRLFPGKSVSISTNIGQVPDAYCIPYSALVGEKETMHVNLVRNQKVVGVPVDLESLDAYKACVKGALNANDYLVVSGSNYLSDGDIADKLDIRHQ